MLTSVLPVPKHRYSVFEEEEVLDAPKSVVVKSSHIPTYPNRVAAKFVPQKVEDYEDGGAYPELHIVQYPLNMGKPGAQSTAIISVDVDEKGQIRYDALVKQGNNKNKLIQSTFDDIKEKEATESSINFPDEDEEQAAANKTRLALEALLDSKIASSKPSTVVHTSEIAEANYIRYTPNPDAPGYSDASKQRVIRMVEAQVDPMEPPKHKHKKVPRGPPSPPVPVLHSPPRKLTVADQQAWKVPPCISNWKNARGYTIPLDKRLAADGRGLQDVTINNKFAMLSEALYISERKAAEDLSLRNQIRKKMALQEKENREAELREMALKARMNRAGVSLDEPDEEEDAAPRSHYEPKRGENYQTNSPPTHQYQESPERRPSGSDGSRSPSRSPSPSYRRDSGRRSSSPAGDDDRGRQDYSRRKDKEELNSDDERHGKSSHRSDSRRQDEDRDSRRRDEEDSRDTGRRSGDRDRDRDRDRRRSSPQDNRRSSHKDDRDSRHDRSDDRGRHRDDDGNEDRRRESSDRHHHRRDDRRERNDQDDRYGRSNRPSEDNESQKQLQERERIRIERRKEREREMRLENMKGAFRKKKQDRDAGRDVSEKIALGMHKGTGQLTGESQFDSRLFNQSSGMDSGFGADDDYSTYSKPLFDRSEGTGIYRPKRDDADIYGDVDSQMAKLSDTSKFKPDKGFAGTQGAPTGGGGRTAPVQFEKTRSVVEDEEDAFEIGDIIQPKRARKD